MCFDRPRSLVAQFRELPSNNIFSFLNKNGGAECWCSVPGLWWSMMGNDRCQYS